METITFLFAVIGFVALYFVVGVVLAKLTFKFLIKKEASRTNSMRIAMGVLICWPAVIFALVGFRVAKLLEKVIES